MEEHQLDEYGEHDPDECESCVEKNHTSCGSCRCGRCCRGLLIEASLRDAEREPRIQTEAGGIYEGPPITATRELVGYLLNGKGGPCVFLDRETNHCTIYETRPLVCRVFDCDEYRRGIESGHGSEARATVRLETGTVEPENHS
ncbi:MAG: YkgJ family cysteine cluster protein [Pirellulales bacterium]